MYDRMALLLYPRIIKFPSTDDDISIPARSRRMTENETDTASMQSFFTKAGLSLEKSIFCAERSVKQDIHTPRRLFYYIQSVPAFTLLDLGIDRFDADMVLEDLNKEFGVAPISFASEKDVVAPPPTPAASPILSPLPILPPVTKKKNPRKMTSSEVSVARLMDSIIELNESETEEEAKKMINNAVNSTRRSRAATRQKDTRLNSNNSSPNNTARRRQIDDYDDIDEMQEFFRFAGLSCKMSRSCAEESISMTASSPKKLYKYLEINRLKLSDLGMDIVDVEMVRETLNKTFCTPVLGMTPTSSPKNGHNSSIESKSESDSEDWRKPARSSQNSSQSSKNPSPNNTLSFNDSPYASRYQEELDKPTSLRCANISPPRHAFKQGDSLNQIMLKSNEKDLLHYNNFISELDTKLKPDGTDGTESPYGKSQHSLGVYTALNTLPNRPSSAMKCRMLENGLVPTELLLLRVASVLKRKDKIVYRNR